VNLGGVLLAGAGLKWHQLALEPYVATGPFGSRWFQALLVEYELALALWLCAGCCAGWLWRVSLASFMAFGAAAVGQALAGAESCGCFGSATVSPWVAATIDLTAIAALLACRPRASREAGNATAAEALRSTRVAAISALLIVGVAAAWTMATGGAGRPAAEGITLTGGVYVLEPREWLGKPFPLVEDCDLGEQLSDGRWELVLIHHDCEKCQALVRRIATRPRSGSEVAIIEVPPFGPAAKHADRPWLRPGRLSEGKKWFVVTPVVITLDRGTVVGVSGDD
jgi:hypothetical protein